MRVLLVSRHHGAEIRGATVATHGLVRALAQRGHEVTLIHSARPEHRMQIDGVRILYHRTTRKSLYPILYALHRTRRYDVIHTNDESGGVLALRSRGFRLPLVAHIHASPTKPRSFWQAGWRWRYIELAVRYAPMLITPSRWVIGELATRYGRDKSVFRAIPNGIGEHWFSASTKDPPAGDRRPPRIVLVNMQGVETALRAFALVLRGRDVELELYGRHKEESRYRRLAHELGVDARVRFCGFVPNAELPTRIAGADLLLHPSLRESFGQVLGEAAALGLPAVSSDVDAIPEVVEDGRTGLLAPPGDVGAFATALASLLDDPEQRHRMGAVARQRAERLWRWENVVERLEKEVYGALVRGPSS
ncbi:MAG: glycosyltransferase family 4 protein [Myxococcota bacterium]